MRGIGLDIAEPETIEAALADLGHVDRLALVAVERDYNSAHDYDVARARSIVTMKLIGYTEVAHTLFPRMGAGASAVLFGGLASERPYPGSTSITTVNGAVSSLIRTLAVELAPVRFNAIHPGIISDSPAWQERKKPSRTSRSARRAGARDHRGRGRRGRLLVHEPRRERHQPRHRRRLAADLAHRRPPAAFAVSVTSETSSTEGGQMSDDEPLSRRGLLKSTVAAAASSALLAQTGAFGQAPAAETRKRFKAWISRGDGPGRTTLREATLRPIGGRQVVVRTEATNLCYSNVPAVLGLQPPAGARPSALAAAPGARRLNDMAVIQGHGGIGVVEAVGPEVRRVQVGDRVCVSGTPHCGVLLPVSARPLRHVPVPERDRRRRSRRRSQT